jgi:fucose 4-O-acetylase-like acetyltransferase
MTLMDANKRLLYIDNTRLFVIILVVVMHLSLTYSGSGGWYYTESRLLSGSEGTFFSFLQAFMQAFFMGLLFLIAGYFVPGAYDNLAGFSKTAPSAWVSPPCSLCS